MLHSPRFEAEAVLIKLPFLAGMVGRRGVAAARADPLTLDLGAPAVRRDPFPHYEALRRLGPVHFLPHHGFWIVLGHDEVRDALKQPLVFSSAPFDPIDAVLLGASPPRHAAVRRALSPFFGATALDELTAFAGAHAATLVAPELDVVSGFGLPLSRAVARRLIGFSMEDEATIVATGEALNATADPLGGLIRVLDATADRSLTYRTLRADHGETLSDAEARSLVRLLWLASTMTTERAITRCVLRLLEHPDVRRDVEADTELVPPLVEEVLRLHPPEHCIPRETTAPVTLGGVDIPGGATVQLCLSAANRDPAQFRDPTTLRLDRAPNPHLAFGSGAHHCLGAPLARRVIAAAVRTLLRELPGFQAAQPLDSLPWFMTPTALTPLSLRIAAGTIDSRAS